MEEAFNKFLIKYPKYDSVTSKLSYNIFFDLVNSHEITVEENETLQRYCFEVKKKGNLNSTFYVIPLSSNEQISFSKLKKMTETRKQKEITLGIVDSDMTIVYYDISK